MQSENVNEIALALSKVQGKMLPAIKDSSNPYFKSKYADLASVWDACRNPMHENQLCVTQTMDDTDDSLVVVTTLIHSSGQWIKSKMSVSKVVHANPEKKQLERRMNAQEMGSAITYLRRYSLAAIVGVCTEDDDGNAASRQTHNQAPPMRIVSSQQVNSLQDILAKMPEYKSRVVEYLKKAYNIHDLNSIRADMYDGIMADAKRNLEKTRLETKVENIKTGSEQ